MTQLHIFINSAYLGTYEGRDVVGFPAASRAYFRKEFSELTEDEDLSPVAMLIAPNDLNVVTRPEGSWERVNRIKRRRRLGRHARVH